MSNNKSKSNKGLKALAITLAAVLVVGATYTGLSYGLGSVNPADWVNRTEEVRPEGELFAGTMIVDDNHVNNQSIRLASNTILPSQYAEYGVDEQSLTAYTITAEIQPETALQMITYTAHFADPSSEWANGKDVNDYITITQNDMQLTVSCQQAFGEQIVIDIECAYDNSISSSVYCDYVAALYSAEIADNSSTNTGYCLDSCGECINYDLAFGDGSIIADFAISDVNFVIKDSFKDLLEPANNPYMNIFESSLGLKYSANFDINKLTLIIDEFCYDTISYTELYFNGWRNCITPVKYINPDDPDSGITPSISQIDTNLLQLALRYAVENSSGNDFSVSYNITYTYGDTVLSELPIAYEAYFSDCDLIDYPDATDIEPDNASIVFLPN